MILKDTRDLKKWGKIDKKTKRQLDYCFEHFDLNKTPNIFCIFFSGQRRKNMKQGHKYVNILN